MIRFSPAGPYASGIKPSAKSAPPVSPQFGTTFWDRWRRPEPLIRYDLNKLDSWSGFTPGKTIEELLGIPKKSAVVVITRQSDLDNYWKKLNLPAGEKPFVKFGDEAVLLVADERSPGSAGPPLSIEYSRSRDELRVYMMRDDNGRNQGTSWYVAKVYNGYLPADIRRKFSVWDWFVLTGRTSSSIAKVASR